LVRSGKERHKKPVDHKKKGGGKNTCVYKCGFAKGTPTENPKGPKLPLKCTERTTSHAVSGRLGVKGSPRRNTDK